ncbi:hypothetical protein EYZ11_003482 [Aspergillus tanneri]|uniref:Uncharacterized protein n=1 Tax=Aspergillus tanneri TaxID=1220188 RepID=A0A4S3JN14_9EURO|nr:hypothetical protein EYZ11_003482 [Aspergillus tanneri]
MQFTDLLPNTWTRFLPNWHSQPGIGLSKQGLALVIFGNRPLPSAIAKFSRAHQP